MRVLIVEDDLMARKLLRFVLEEVGGHTVVEAVDGMQGVSLAPEADLIVTDMVMPNLDGFSLCKMLRARSTIPIIAVSASRTQVADRVLALHMGVDDYLSKPFEPAELLARVERLGRRAQTSARVDEAGVIGVGALRLDLIQQTLTIAKRPPIALTPTETRILARLANTPGEVVSRQALQKALWGDYSDESEATLATYFVDLRRKIEPDPKTPRILKTVRNAGYLLDPS